MCSSDLAASLNLLDEALTALRVCITAIHEAVNVCLLQTIFLTYLNQLEEVIINAYSYAQKTGKKLHLLGLTSTGGVHSSLSY